MAVKLEVIIYTDESGTTAIPVLARGGRFTGIEMTNQYFDIACARLEKAQAEAAQV